ncbi:hypothetical protein AB6A40_002772 [Gnathostoma spinigerum]|uniref:BING4 C-terminal domain-containing protein n=1 Tax=Gnathostoma spinigerum TaxID=75299 RepID=A0ABD6EGJ9_9BILA
MESDGTYSKVKMLSAEVLKPNKGIEENMRTSKVRYQQRTFPKKGLLKQTEWKVRRKKNTPAEVPVSQSSLNKHDTGADGINPEHVKTKFHQTKLASKKKKFTERIEQTARAELLNCEEAGFLEGDDNELTCTIRQQEIRDSVDIATASKSFDLCLDRFGPYRLDYTANGRHLLIGGKRGHIAAFDWMTKKLQCEISVLESIRDVQWLHLETMFAVAQKRWTYIYDANGVELHCLKNLHDVRRLEFLPHHFLLVAGTNTSFLHYLDVSLGKLVQSFPTHQGPLNIMTQNPENAIIHTGHSTGTVQLWSPNIRQPLVTLLAHRCGLTGITVEGNYMATAGLDCHLRIWDVRSYRQLYAYALPFGLSEVSFSQRYAVACAVGNSVQVFNDAHLGTATEPYLAHRCTGIIADLRFVPHEDILGVGHCNGFTSLIVPGTR